MCESLEHRGPLFRFIAPAATVSIALGMQPPQGQQLVDSARASSGGPSLVEPERAEGIEGIGIQVGECFPLLPEALRPRRTFFRWQVGLGIKEKRTELGRTTSHVSGQEGRGPGDAVEALERIQGEGLPQGLIGRCTEDGQMLILQQRSETDPRGMVSRNPSRCSSSTREAPRASMAVARSKAMCWAIRARYWRTRSRKATRSGVLAVWRTAASNTGSGMAASARSPRSWERVSSAPAARSVASRRVIVDQPLASSLAASSWTRAALTVSMTGIQRQLDKRPCVGRDHLQKRPGGRCEGVETLRGEGFFHLAAVELKQMRSQDSRGPIEVPGLQICVQHCRELLGGESLCDRLQTMEHIGSGKEVGQWLGAHAFSFTTGSPSKA